MSKARQRERKNKQVAFVDLPPGYVLGKFQAWVDGVQVKVKGVVSEGKDRHRIVLAAIPPKGAKVEIRRFK